MSLLLKALRQAEAANAAQPGMDKSVQNKTIDGHLELEPVTPASAGATEWVEPPGLLFGNSGVTPEARHAPRFRWPQLSLVPLTALLAVLVALGYGIYLYFALQPPSSIATANVAVPVVAPAASVNPTLAESEPVALPASPAPQTVPSPPAAPAEAALLPAPARSTPRIASSARKTLPPATPLPATPLQFQPDVQTTLLGQAYAAYQRGALNEAQRLYTQAAARGRSVDALLGLAAIASVQNREADAQRLYREVLDIDPRNATAQGALLDLLGNTDNHAAESRLKTLIDRDPSPQLYQTLGNLYADQKRWNDAQAAYFEAYRGAPDNADYAFNLAVSLDQLRQFSAARTYYEKALAIGGVHRFERAQAEARLQQLKSAR